MDPEGPWAEGAERVVLPLPRGEGIGEPPTHRGPLDRDPQGVIRGGVEPEVVADDDRVGMRVDPDLGHPVQWGLRRTRRSLPAPGRQGQGGGEEDRAGAVEQAHRRDRHDGGDER